MAEQINRGSGYNPNQQPNNPDTDPLTWDDNASDADATKAEINALLDKDTRFIDAEILGKRLTVELAVRDIGNEYIKSYNMFKANWRNRLDAPGKYVRSFRANVAERRFNRHQKRLDEVESLPDTSRLKKRRIRKFAKAKTKMLETKASYNIHKTRMENRVKAVHENADTRREAYVRELKVRRDEALLRRDARRNKKLAIKAETAGKKALTGELRNQGATLLERRAIMKEVPQEHWKKVGHVAVQVSAAERAAKKTNRDVARAEKKATSHDSRLSEKIQKNEALVAEHSEEANNAETELTELSGAETEEGSLAYAQQHAEGLQARLEAMNEDDPNRTELEILVREANEAVRVKEAKIAFWESAKAKNIERVEQLQLEQERLQAQIGQHDGTVEEKRNAQDAENRRLDNLKAIQSERLQEALNEEEGNN